MNNCLICLNETTTYVLVKYVCKCKLYGHVECIGPYLDATNRCLLCKKDCKKERREKDIFLSFFWWIDSHVTIDQPFLFIFFLLAAVMFIPLYYMCYYMSSICDKKYNVYKICK